MIDAHFTQNVVLPTGKTMGTVPQEKLGAGPVTRDLLRVKEKIVS